MTLMEVVAAEANTERMNELRALELVRAALATGRSRSNVAAVRETLIRQHPQVGSVAISLAIESVLREQS